MQGHWLWRSPSSAYKDSRQSMFIGALVVYAGLGVLFALAMIAYQIEYLTPRGMAFRPLAIIVVIVFLLAVSLVVSLLVDSAWFSYALTSGSLAVRGYMPPQTMTFLGDMRRLGLLRTSGMIYQFRHIDLQRHFAPRHEIIDNETDWHKERKEARARIQKEIHDARIRVQRAKVNELQEGVAGAESAGDHVGVVKGHFVLAAELMKLAKMRAEEGDIAEAHAVAKRAAACCTIVLTTMMIGPDSISDHAPQSPKQHWQHGGGPLGEVDGVTVFAAVNKMLGQLNEFIRQLNSTSG